MNQPPVSRLGPYEVKSIIGRGGMGEVYRGWDARLGREVAVKIMPAAVSSNTDRLRRFEQEARAAAALNHPNIVAVFDVGNENGNPYVVTELLHGETLREALQAGRLPFRKALDYATQIATGLAAAHDQGIVHRDIKPENIFVKTDGQVKILDFGLAKLRESGSSGIVEAVTLDKAGASTEGLVVGTAGYMSPEQVRGDRVDQRSDIFSFGATFYEMVSGARAFHGDTAIETLHAILNQEPPDLSDTVTRPDLVAIVQHCLEKSPAHRFQSALDLAFALKQLTAPSSSSAIVGKVATGRMRLTWLNAAALLVAVAGFAATYLSRPSAPAPDAPRFRQLTFRLGHLEKARFAPDGQTVISAAAWDGAPTGLQSTRIDTRASTPLLAETELESVSKSGELAVVVRGGTLARVPLGQSGAREMLDRVSCADWMPDGTLAVVRFDGSRTWLEYPPGQKLFEDEAAVIQAMRVSPDGQLIALIEQESLGAGAEWLTIVNRAGAVKSRSRRWSGTDDRLAWTPNSAEVWFTGNAGDAGPSSAIFAMTTEGVERIVYRAPGSVRVEDIAPDGRVLVVGDTNRGELRVVDTRTGTNRDLTWNGRSIAFGISSDGQRVIFHDDHSSSGDAFIRPTDGGPAVELGEGFPTAVSPDGEWVLSQQPAKMLSRLVPIGAGEAIIVNLEGLTYMHLQANWTPDGKRILLVGRQEKDGPPQVFATDRRGAAPVSVTPDGIQVSKFIVSPDSATIAAVDSTGTIRRYRLDGAGSPTELAGQMPDDKPLAWSNDNLAVWVLNRNGTAVKVFRIALKTGQRTLWYQLPTLDVASVGLDSLRVHMSGDGRTLVYSYLTRLSSLYVAEGLR